MTCETSALCQNCGKENFIRYGSGGWTEWQVCPHCGLAELNQEVFESDDEESHIVGDEALSVFLCICGGEHANQETVSACIEKYFSGQGSEDNIYKYSEEQISEMLNKRKSINYWQQGKEPYIMAMIRRIDKEKTLCE